MNNAIKTDAETNSFTVALDGEVLTYSPENDARIAEVIDGKVFTTTLEGAETLAAELQLFGITEARAFNYAVVFWS